jgi:hypothetical protein
MGVKPLGIFENVEAFLQTKGHIHKNKNFCPMGRVFCRIVTIDFAIGP